MPTSGGGSGTQIQTGPVAAFTDFGGWPVGAVSLSRYAKIVGYSEAAFFGLVRPEDPDYACRDIWTKTDRDLLAQYLYEAQVDIENEIGYKLQPTWVIEDAAAGSTILTRWAKIIAGGQRAEEIIAENYAVNYATEPATVGPIAVTFTDASEARLYYPGTNQEIEPSKTVISGGFVTFYIPKARMVAAEKLQNPVTGLDYSDASNFQPSVKVSRVYNDASLSTEILRQKQTGDTCTQTVTPAACFIIRDAEAGIVQIRGRCATQCSDGVLTGVRLYYYSGLTPISFHVENAIIRLAHSRMPDAPCGCEAIVGLWRRDRNVPEVLTRERENAPFGMSDGAWYAYNQALGMKKYRIGVMY